MLRGALIEYGSGLIGPIPNVVIFQFNPESLSRSAADPAAADRRDPARDDPGRRKDLREDHVQGALQRRQHARRRQGAGASCSASARSSRRWKRWCCRAPSSPACSARRSTRSATRWVGGGGDAPAQPIPREKYPRILFIWGLTRVLPVTIDSMTITELEYDVAAQPAARRSRPQLSVIAVDQCSDDVLAKGALEYSTIAKEAQAIANLANTAEQIVELIPL